MKKKVYGVYLYFGIFILLLLFISCKSLNQKKNLKSVQEFYQTYADRKDIKKLMNFYSASPQYIDAVSQIRVEGKENVESQYTWTDPAYKVHPQYPKAVKIDQIISNDSVVVVSGQYNPYYYNDKLINEMQFNSWFYFDKEGKIERQIEWVQYPIDLLEEIITIKKSMQIN